MYASSWLLAILVLVCAGCSSAKPPKAASHSEFDAPIFTKPDKVVAQRLKFVDGSGERRFYGMTATKKPVPLSKARIQALLTLLRQAEAHPMPSGKGCEPIPGVAVEFSRRGESEWILLCFDCDMYTLSKEHVLGWADFDPYHKDLVKWVQGVFPKDNEIQGLSMESGGN